MKKDYECPKIEFLLLGKEDIITLSGGGFEGPIVSDGPIGGGGYDSGGWT
ncbi:MAG: hypothetical protein IJC64_01890 [Clostridia bacterium]|nr:hypothetical protein [Clostridia bacterium]